MDTDMFNLFKKKKKKTKAIQEWEFVLLKSIVEKLPSKYSFLNDLVNPEFILDSVPNEFLEDGWKRTICNQNLYESYKNNDINYKLVGIKVFDIKTNSYKNVELDLYEGIMIGYKLDTSCHFDFSKVDVENVREIPYENMDKQELEKILDIQDPTLLSQLDIEETFKIEIEEGEFYVIKDLEDGNYLSIDKTGAVYGMIHDPYEVEKLFDNQESFSEALRSGSFNISEYYNKKMS